MLICAGGKQSPLKQRFFPSSSSVTESKFYGVCSWLSNDIRIQDKKSFNLFDDFRGMALLDKFFIDKFEDAVIKFFHDLQLPNHARTAILETVDAEIKKLKATPLKHIQTRTFENLGLIYIGMELPQELQSLMNSLQKTLESKNVVDAKEKLKSIQKLWFQQYMSTHVPYLSELTESKIDTNFSAMFPVDQHRMHPDHLISYIQKGSSFLFIAAAGDAFSSPHFMRYSGLSGGRENVFQLQYYTKNIAQLKDRGPLLNHLRFSYERIAQFVISRGGQFLASLSEQEIKNNRLKAVIKSLDDKIIENHTVLGLDYKIVKIDEGIYALRASNREYLVIPKDGYVEIEGVNYDSIEKFVLEL